MISLDWAELSIHLEPEGPWRPPAFSGPMLRGALAMALRRLVCVMRRSDCEGCALVNACLYPRLFETRPDPRAGVLRRYDRAPHPILIVAALRDAAGDPPASDTLTVRLFGTDLLAAPFVIRAAVAAAERGLGAGRVPFRVTAVTDPEGRALGVNGTLSGVAQRPPPPALPPRRRWSLRSPLRVFANGRPLDAAGLDGPALARAVLRRVGLMAQFYANGRPELDFQGLAAEAERVRIVARDLRWQPLRRWSGRQRATQAIGGLIGEMTLDFAGAPRLASLADWVPVVHLGKETSMGLGHIVAEAA